MPVGKDNDILTLLQGVLADLEGVWDAFLRDDDPTFQTPRSLFTVKFETIYGEQNPATNDYETITYVYKIEEFITFKKGTPEQSTVGDYVSKAAQVARLKVLINSGMFIRSYDYINTSTNTEVIDFDINLKMFYYEALHSEGETTTASGMGTSESTNERDYVRKEREEESKARNAPSLLAGNNNPANTVLYRLFGDEIQEIDKEAEINPKTALAILGASVGERPISQQFGNINSGAHKRRDKYTQYFDQHFKNDLLSLNDMKIRGDPVWFFSPYGSVDLLTKNLDNDNGEYATKPSTNVAKVIYLRIIPPWQGDFMNPDRTRASSYPNILGGFYELTKVKSILSGGLFTQVLDGYKLNHLNYVEQYFKKVDIVEPYNDETQ